jgi:coenzyme PQQ synthesis protein D (PqqD)
MSPNTTPDTSSLPEVKVKVPQHVVYRSFPSETVVLNVNTGRYHGLNAAAGRMLDALAQAPCVSDAAVVIAASYDQPQAVVEQDMCELCQLLLERDLIEIEGGAPS